MTNLSWEKTVEWAYVKNHLGNVSFAAPIDGEAEISDALLGENGSWILIEFKHEMTDFKAEKKKFPEHQARALSILKKNYKLTEEEVKALTDRELASDEWLNKAIEIENKYFKSISHCDGDAPIFQAAYGKYLWFKKYFSEKKVGQSILEPHFFVFSEAKNFQNLLALPYWISWENPKKNTRGWKPIKADQISSKGCEFGIFSTYVEYLSIARGYNLKDIMSEEGAMLKGIVFGKLTGLTETIAMTFEDFLLAQEGLKYAYSNKLKELEAENAAGTNDPHNDINSRPI